jgi:hypothetical protein
MAAGESTTDMTSCACCAFTIFLVVAKRDKSLLKGGARYYAVTSVQEVEREAGGNAGWVVRGRRPLTVQRFLTYSQLMKCFAELLISLGHMGPRG